MTASVGGRDVLDVGLVVVVKVVVASVVVLMCIALGEGALAFRLAASCLLSNDAILRRPLDLCHNV